MNWNVDKGNKKPPEIHIEQTHLRLLRLLLQNPRNISDEWKLGDSWTATDVYKAVTSCE